MVNAAKEILWERVAMKTRPLPQHLTLDERLALVRTISDNTLHEMAATRIISTRTIVLAVSLTLLLVAGVVALIMAILR
jgi:hypothetical protein